jgi:GABA(A) receptor-associated protein
MSYFFKKNHYESISKKLTVEERTEQSTKVLNKYPERIPVVVEPLTNDIPSIDKNKFIVSKDMTFGQFIYIIRKRLKIESDVALFFSVNGSLCTSSSDIGTIYAEKKNEDNFLYIKYTTENTFG